MQGFFDRFRSAPAELAPANVDVEWDTAGHWRSWEAPGNFVVGESHYTEALTALAGPPCAAGYLIPVTVTIARDPQNAYDSNAFRAEVDGRQVGYLPRHIAAQLAAPLDSVGCAGFDVCGILRGGSDSAPNLGVHIWLDRRLSPGPEIIQRDEAGRVSWPPDQDEGNPNAPGLLRGKHFTDYVEKVKNLRRNGQAAEAEQLLLELIDATEAESKAKGLGVAPWYYEQLAVLYSKQGEKDREILILQRFAGQKHARGATPPRLLERLEKKKAARTKAAGEGGTPD
jgi:HIRAN domain